MKQQILKTYAMTLQEARKLAGDVPADRATELPFAAAKHPGWVLGHLSLASGMAAAYLAHPTAEEAGLEGVPEAWLTSCMGEPTNDLAAYGSPEACLAELERVHGLLAERFEAADDALLNTPFPKEEWRSFFPTLGDMAFYMLSYHEGYHLGQLSQWRRAIGMAPAPE